MEDKPKKFRSPQFPFISLEKAVSRVGELESKYAHNSARASNASGVWDYSPKSSGALQTIAALLAYGLLEDEGSRENRRLKVSALGMTILKDQRPGAREGALKKAALLPPVMSELWNDWGAKRPPTPECVSTLHLDMGFSQDAATRAVAIYDANIAYASLGDSDKLPQVETPGIDGEAHGDKDKRRESPPPSGIKAGDFVQWESSGVLQFEAPRKVTSFSSDEQFVFVEGSMTGLPIAEVSLQSMPQQTETPMDTLQPPVKPPAPGAKQDTFSLDEGQVVLQWPSKMSKNSYEDFKDWIELQVRKIGRAVE